MGARFTDNCHNVFVAANLRAQERSKPHIEPELILYELLAVNKGMGRDMLEYLGINPEKIRSVIQAKIGDILHKSVTYKRLPFSPTTREVAEQAKRIAEELSFGFIGTEHLLLALIKDELQDAAKILSEQGLTYEKLKHAVLVIHGRC